MKIKLRHALVVGALIIATLCLAFAASTHQAQQKKVPPKVNQHFKVIHASPADLERELKSLNDEGYAIDLSERPLVVADEVVIIVHNDSWDSSDEDSETGAHRKR
jgi:cell division protein FtsB